MRLFSIVVLASLLVCPSFAQSPAPVSPDTRTAVRQLIGDIMLDGKAYDYDRELADSIGPRLTGSDNYVHAVSWATEQFKSLGLTNVHTEPFTIPTTWEPEIAATGRIIEPRVQTLHIYSLGWSPSTPDNGVRGPVVYLKHLTTEEIASERDRLSGKIILLDRDSLGPEPKFAEILQSLDRIKDVHPLALLLVGGPNGTESTTALTFDGDLSTFPTAQVGLEDVLLIKRMLERGPVTVEFFYKNRIRKNVEVNNVIAEIPGAEKPNEVVIVAGHLDS